eukprot:CAMPEP_0197861958 /NCGR_PEP_ID=MMETSP1438-20131217/38333_1 /TAXON_ID=1461541 /ORGANISM="Pterosperma sp., Strain CCMP1384" /LENGTH=163 /DNA_ID=CAMNT_0043479327 /DNA_START=96 /DNA_END=584 /DNA_ORIENTATION=+
MADYPDLATEYPCNGRNLCKGEYEDLLCLDNEYYSPTVAYFLQSDPYCFEYSTRDWAHKEFRTLSLVKYSSETGNTVAWFDLTGYNQLQSGMNILGTIFVIMLLVAWSYTFSKDANNLLIQPIERMVTFIKQLAADPLSQSVKQKKQELTGTETDRLYSSLNK